jgi:exodeoxyribonuclease VII large subunit
MRIQWLSVAWIKRRRILPRAPRAVNRYHFAMETAAPRGDLLGRPDRDVYTVTRLNREVRVLLERGFGVLWLEAEISNLSRPSSGHWYFSLKDAQSQVRCCMFRQRNMLCRFTARDGQKVLVRARISLYEPKGEFQLVIEHMEDAGLGALKLRFEELSARLAAEGLFSEARKRALPRLPRRIGIITSPTGAAVRDILKVLARRFAAVPVLIYPTSVQGSFAAGEIVEALRLAGQRRECDVLVLARGGGSLEDLWPFNEESVARAIVASPLPVVSGVGHEIDLTIADFAADVRAPTPSAAAELVVPDAEEWRTSCASLGQRIVRALRRRLAERRERLRWLEGRAQLASPTARLLDQAQRLDDYERRLLRALRRRHAGLVERLRWLEGRAALASPATRLARRALELEALERRLAAAGRDIVHRARGRLAPLERALHAVSPRATLARGYAIVRTETGAIVRDAGAVEPGALIEAHLARGALRARVEKP